MSAVDAALRPVLVGCDGSADARAAIDHVAELLPGAGVTILTVWEPLAGTLMRTGPMGGGGQWVDVEKADAASAVTALACATDGAERATAAGLDARPLVVASHDGVAVTILATAADLDAPLVVLGTRGRGGVGSLLLGSVSQSVIHHADRPVLVVPDADLARRRQERLHATTVPA